MFPYLEEDTGYSARLIDTVALALETLIGLDN